MAGKLTTILFLAAIALGALVITAMTSANPALAKSSGGLAFMSARQLQSACKTQGGTYGTSRPLYYCVLGSQAIICNPPSHQCVLSAVSSGTAAGQESTGPDYPPASLSDGLLTPDLPAAAPIKPIGPIIIAPPTGPIERGHGPRIPH